jgi:hypothetical protein
MRNEKRNTDQKTGGRPKILSKIWETERKKGCPHRCQYVSTTLLHGDLDTPPQVSQVSQGDGLEKGKRGGGGREGGRE